MTEIPNRRSFLRLLEEVSGDRLGYSVCLFRIKPTATFGASFGASHATGQIVRCFAMKTNFMSLPSRSRSSSHIRSEDCQIAQTLRLHYPSDGIEIGYSLRG